jgi:histone-binding protein RBBP4
MHWLILRQDVDWHATKDNVFASVGDDKYLMMCAPFPALVFEHDLELLSSWDTRTPTEPTMKFQAHDREILAVAFSPASEHLLVTGSADKVSSSQLARLEKF